MLTQQTLKNIKKKHLERKRGVTSSPSINMDDSSASKINDDTMLFVQGEQVNWLYDSMTALSSMVNCIYWINGKQCTGPVRPRHLCVCACRQPASHVNNMTSVFPYSPGGLHTRLCITAHHHRGGSSQRHSIRGEPRGEEINWRDKTPRRAAN